MKQETKNKFAELLAAQTKVNDQKPIVKREAKNLGSGIPHTPTI